MEPDNYDKENAFLKKEVQHRVRNNIQVISSLLQMQMHFLDESEEFGALQEARMRVNALGLVFEQSYSDLKPDQVNMEIYLGHLIARLKTQLNRSLPIEYQIDYPWLPLESANSIGLIINEFAIKWNQIKSEKPLKIKLKKQSENTICLSFQSEDQVILTLLEKDQPVFSNKLIQIMTHQLEGKIEPVLPDLIELKFPIQPSKSEK